MKPETRTRLDACLTRWATAVACLLFSGLAVAQPATPENTASRKPGSQPSGMVSLANAAARLQVSYEGKNAWFSSLRQRNDATDFITPTATPVSLWTIEVRTPQNLAEGRMLEPSNASSFSAASRKNVVTGRTRVSLCWLGVGASDVEGSFDVEVTGELEGQQAVSEWRIRVSARSPSHGLWEVCFPRIGALRACDETELMLPGCGGFVQKPPLRTTHPMGLVFDANYPSAAAPLQCASIARRGAVLYLAAHDPGGHPKRFRVARDGAAAVYGITTPVSDMGRPGVSYEQSHPFALGVFPGDWYDAAKNYRAWGEKKARFFAQGKLARRRDVPVWIKEVPAWVLFNGLTEANMKQVEDWKSFLGTPLAAHIYHWYPHPHDTKYPDFLPPSPAFGEYVRRCQKAGVKVVPYINAHLIDTNSVFYRDHGGDDLIAMPPGRKPQPSQEWKGDGSAANMPACPSVKAYQEAIVGLAAALVRDYGVDGVYFDQVACVPPHPCFNPRHPHPPGGADRWTGAYCELLETARQLPVRHLPRQRQRDRGRTRRRLQHLWDGGLCPLVHPVPCPRRGIGGWQQKPLKWDEGKGATDGHGSARIPWSPRFTQSHEVTKEEDVSSWKIHPNSEEEPAKHAKHAEREGHAEPTGWTKPGSVRFFVSPACLSRFPRVSRATSEIGFKFQARGAWRRSAARKVLPLGTGRLDT